MDNYISKARTITVFIMLCFGLMGTPDIGVLAAANKLNPQPDEMTLDTQYEAEIAGLSDADAAYVRV